MINLTLYKDKTIQMTLKIRSKDKAVLTLIMKKLKDLTF